jgi:hypothetical protein
MLPDHAKDLTLGLVDRTIGKRLMARESAKTRENGREPFADLSRAP